MTASSQVKRHSRIKELDGLRGVAILLVISFHYINNQLVHTNSSVGKVLYTLTSFGWVGVDLFFVLSGFLIGTILIVNKGSKTLLRSFFIKRFLRIVPNYYLLLLVFIVIWNIPYFGNNQFLTGDITVPVWSYFPMVHNLYMAGQNSMGNAVLSVTWSIGIEEQFYLIFPWISTYLNQGFLLIFLVLAILLAPYFRMQYDSWIPPYVLLFCRMDALAMGVLIAYLFNKTTFPDFARKQSWLMILILVMVSIVCGFLYLKFNDLGVMRNTLFAVFFGAALILALVKSDSLYGAVLRNKLLMWIGALSYSLYLFHYLILGLFHHVNGNTGISINNFSDVILSASALLFSVFFAWLVYNKLEKPMVMFGRRYKYSN